ncbi:Hypothetical protein FKW44_017035, partial [Caligus rogercresseyi]
DLKPSAEKQWRIIKKEYVIKVRSDAAWTPIFIPAEIKFTNDVCGSDKGPGRYF